MQRAIPKIACCPRPEVKRENAETQEQNCPQVQTHPLASCGR